MCNLYSITTNQAAIAALFRVVNRYVGNLAPMPGVFPDYPAPVVRNTDTGRELSMMRWGMPPPPRTGGPPVTNIRNTSSPHWRGWLKPENRCLVPANSFAEYAPEPNPETKYAPLDLLPVRKIGGPGHSELAVDAMIDGAARTVINEDVVRTDDGIATGASARVALHAVRAERTGIGSYCAKPALFGANHHARGAKQRPPIGAFAEQMKVLGRFRFQRSERSPHGRGSAPQFHDQFRTAAPGGTRRVAPSPGA